LTKPQTIDNPRPVPFPSGLVEKKGSNTLLMSSDEIPQPCSQHPGDEWGADMHVSGTRKMAQKKLNREMGIGGAKNRLTPLVPNNLH
jgi:hypothetical protein